MGMLFIVGDCWMRMSYQDGHCRKCESGCWLPKTGVMQGEWVVWKLREQSVASLLETPECVCVCVNVPACAFMCVYLPMLACVCLPVLVCVPTCT